VNITGNTLVGPLVGLAGTTSITNCYTSSGTVTGTQYVGGLVGYLFSSASITNTYSNVDNVTASSNYIGGLVGRIYSSTILNSYSTGKVVSTNSRGGLVGAFIKVITPLLIHFTILILRDNQIQVKVKVKPPL